MSKEKTHHKTIVVSDIHLGSKWSKAKEVTKFLKQNTCDTLILCGDIIDGWVLLRGKKKKWAKQHTDFFRYVLSILDKTKVYYVKGNHDDFLNRLVPLAFYNFSIISHFIYESNNKRYYVFHGDIFDNVTAGFRWISKLGDIGYNILLNFNRIYNKYRQWRGLPYFSISAIIKQKVKASVSHQSNFEEQVINIAKSNHCDGAICGHIHRPEISQMGDILYLNSGDWVESLSALTEDFEGNWNLAYYPKEDITSQHKI